MLENCYDLLKVIYRQKTTKRLLEVFLVPKTFERSSIARRPMGGHLYAGEPLEFSHSYMIF